MTAIRDARSSDLPTLRVIQAATLAEPWPALLELGVGGPPILLVSTDLDGEPIGYALTIVGIADRAPDAVRTPDDTNRDDPSAERALSSAVIRSGGETPDSTAYLAELAVADPYQGSGRGSALLDDLVSRLRADGCDRLRVTVRERDRRALAFYRDRGFERRDRLPDHYESGDGLLLVRSLQE